MADLPGVVNASDEDLHLPDLHLGTPRTRVRARPETNPVLNATFATVAPEDLPRLRRWLATLGSRGHELAESYRREGTRHELFFLVHSSPQPLLVLISEADDLENAAVSFLRSNLPLDLEFKRLVQDIAHDEKGVELLFDSSDVLGRSPA